MWKCSFQTKFLRGGFYLWITVKGVHGMKKVEPLIKAKWWIMHTGENSTIEARILYHSNSYSGHSMLNLKFSRFFVTICHETFLFVLFLKEYKKWWRIQKNFWNCFNTSQVIAIWNFATRERFSPAFQKIGCHMNTRAAECMKIGNRVFFRSGNPFWKSKILENESFRV